MFPSPTDAECELQRAVLRLLLVEHPAPITAEELKRAVAAPRGSAAEPVAEAVDALVGAGLVHWNGEFVAASRAAVYFDRLQVD